eukprot:9604307-Alexandrium_andersonii.AAC.1
MGSAPVRAKARLCCGGHRDPDLMEGEMRTDAPTISREVLGTPLSIGAYKGWKRRSADIEDAPINGGETPRGLY